jgi:hypothetical protein
VHGHFESETMKVNATSIRFREKRAYIQTRGEGMWISLYVIYSHWFTQMNFFRVAVLECNCLWPFLEVALNLKKKPNDL